MITSTCNEETLLILCASLAIWPPGSRVDVCVRSPGQVRKEAAQVDCGGSLGSFSLIP